MAYKQIQTQIMENIGIKQSDTVYRLCMDDIELYNHLYRKYRNNISNDHMIQFGGKIYKETYQMNDTKFLIQIDEQKTKKGGCTYDIAIHRNDDPNLSKCLYIAIDNKIAYIREISYYSNCAQPLLDNPMGGSKLLKLCIQFLKENKKRFNINKIQLKDNSTLFCQLAKNKKERMKLPLLSTITCGHTWYGKYGFRPYDPWEDKPDEKQSIRYKNNFMKINTTLTRDTKIFNYICDLMINKGTSEDDAKKWFDRLTEKYGNLTIAKFFQYIEFKLCGLLINFYEKLAHDLDIYNFYGDSFYLEL